MPARERYSPRWLERSTVRLASHLSSPKPLTRSSTSLALSRVLSPEKSSVLRTIPSSSPGSHNEPTSVLRLTLRPCSRRNSPSRYSRVPSAGRSTSRTARWTSCSGMPAAAATCTRTSGETEGLVAVPRVHLRELSSEARRRTISTSAGLRRLSLLPSIWGVILQVLEPLISLGGDRQDPRRILQVGPARKQGKDHGDQHHPPPDLGDDPLPACRPRLAYEEYEDGEALGVHLRLAPAVSGDDLPGLEGD